MYLQPLHRAVLRENAVYRQNKKGFEFAIKGVILFWFWACLCLFCFFSQRMDIGVLLVCREVFALASTINTLLSSRPGGERDAHQYSVQLCGAPGRRDGTKQQMRIW